MPVEVVFAGSGDAFGSGGRLQTTICVRGIDGCVLLDCGTTALVALRRAGIDPNSVRTVVLTHLHGDHFGGLPFLILDGQFAHRERDLTVVGPVGTSARLEQAMDVLFPGMSTAQRRFDMKVIEIRAGMPAHVGEAEVTGFEVTHPSGAPALAIRLRYRGRVIAYTGDTEWTPQITHAADGADLLIAEAYTWSRSIKYHLRWTDLAEHFSELRCRRLVVTHMSTDMLGHVDDLPAAVVTATDGAMVVL
jgi:ribonuclease BN (tRNA processing enzyme)